MIGYPSGNDGSVLPARDYPLYPAMFFFSGVLSRSINKRKKNSVGHYPAILTSRLVNTVYKRYDWTIINRFCRAFAMNVIKQEEEER